MSKAAFSPPVHDGRSDTIKAKAKPGSYVMPADAVSALGRGSSEAGAKHLDTWVASHGLTPIGRVPTPKGKHPKMNLTKGAFADGGAVDIMISPDEYMFPHDFPSKLGGGDHSAGIAKLDAIRARLHAALADGSMKDGAFANGGPIGYDTGGVIGAISGASAPAWDPSPVSATTGMSGSQTHAVTNQAQTLDSASQTGQTSTAATTNTGTTNTQNNSATTSTGTEAYNGAFAPAATAVANQAAAIAANPKGQVNVSMNPQVGQSVSDIAGQTGAFSQQLQPALATTNALQQKDPSVTDTANQLGKTVTATNIKPAAFDAQPYMNPFTKDVIDTTSALAKQQNDQQMAQLMAQSAGRGAFGDQSGIASAVLQGQQDLALQSTIASLNKDNYSQAAAQSNVQQNLGMQADQANQSAALQAAGLTQAGLNQAGNLKLAQGNQQLTAALGGNTITQQQYQNLTDMLNKSGQLGLQQYQAALAGNQAGLAWLNAAINGVSIGTKTNSATGSTTGGSTSLTNGTSTTSGSQNTNSVSSQAQNTQGVVDTDYAQQNVGTTSGAKPNEVGPGGTSGSTNQGGGGTYNPATGTPNTSHYKPATGSNQSTPPSSVPDGAKEYTNDSGKEIWVSPDGVLYDNQGTPVPPSSSDYYWPPAADLPQGWETPVWTPPPGDIFTGGTGGVPYTDGNGNPSTDPGTQQPDYNDPSYWPDVGQNDWDYAAGGMVRGASIKGPKVVKPDSSANPLHGDVTRIDRRLGFTPNHMGGAPAAAPHAMRNVNIPFKPPLRSYAEGGELASVDTGPGRIQKALAAFGVSDRRPSFADGGDIRSMMKDAVRAAFLTAAPSPYVTSSIGIPGVTSSFGIPGVTSQEGIPGVTSSFGIPGVTSHEGIPGVTTSFGIPGVTTPFGIPGVRSTDVSGDNSKSNLIINDPNWMQKAGIRSGFASGGHIRGYDGGGETLDSLVRPGPLPEPAPAIALPFEVSDGVGRPDSGPVIAISNDVPEEQPLIREEAPRAAAAFAPKSVGLTAEDLADRQSPDALTRARVEAKILNSPRYQEHMKQLLGTTDKAVEGIGHGTDVLGSIADNPGIAYRGFGNADKRAIASLVTPAEQMAALDSDPDFLNHQTAYALARSKNMSGGIVDFADRLQHAADQNLIASTAAANARILGANGQYTGGDTLLKAVPSAMTALPGLSVPGGGGAGTMTPIQAIELQKAQLGVAKAQQDARVAANAPVAGDPVNDSDTMVHDSNVTLKEQMAALQAARNSRANTSTLSGQLLLNGVRGLNNAESIGKIKAQWLLPDIDKDGHATPSAFARISSALGGDLGKGAAQVLQMAASDAQDEMHLAKEALGAGSRVTQQEVLAAKGLIGALNTGDARAVAESARNYVLVKGLAQEALAKYEADKENGGSAHPKLAKQSFQKYLDNFIEKVNGEIGRDPLDVEAMKKHMGPLVAGNMNKDQMDTLNALGEKFKKTGDPRLAVRIDRIAGKRGAYQYYLD